MTDPELRVLVAYASAESARVPCTPLVRVASVSHMAVSLVVRIRNKLEAFDMLRCVSGENGRPGIFRPTARAWRHLQELGVERVVSS